MSHLALLSGQDCIQDGVNPRPGVLLLACTIGENYDNPESKVFAFKDGFQDGAWLEFSVEGLEVTSIDASSDGAAYALGEDGTMVECDWKRSSTDDELCQLSKITEIDSDLIGPLNVVRVLTNAVVCGGYGGEFYRFKKGRFISLPALELEDIGLTIQDICGTSFTDFIVVTDEGYCASFDGKKWHPVDLPTNVRLTSACLLADNNYAISGYNGTVLIGKHDDWKIINPSGSEREYSGIAEAHGILYVSHPRGIDFLEDDELVPLETPDAENVDFVVLRSGPDGIWSFGGQSVGLIKDKQWRTVIAP